MTLEEFDLLLPFDPCLHTCGIDWTSDHTFVYYDLISGPDTRNNIVMARRDSGEYVLFSADYRFKAEPLTWVAGRPVYIGSILYRNNMEVTISGVDEAGYLEFDNGQAFISDKNSLTWGRETHGWFTVKKSQALTHEFATSYCKNNPEYLVIYASWEE